MTLKITGFTPAFDHLLENYGPIRALVFGKYWRYWAAYGKACNRQEAMAAQIGIDDRTLRNHLKALVTDGYLEDLTPKVKNRPHSYIPTSKITIEIEARAKVQPNAPSQPESNAGQAESDSGQTPPQPESNAGQAESDSVEDTVTETQLKETITEEDGMSLFFGGLKGKVKNERAAKALNDAAQRETAGIVVWDSYPADVQDLLTVFSDVFQFPREAIPTGKSVSGDWIRDLRQFQTLCNGTGARAVMEEIRKMAKKGEWTVARPGSLLKSVPLAIRTIKAEEEPQPTSQPASPNGAWTAEELKKAMEA